MNNLFSVGISYKTAPIEVRERVFLRPVERELLLSWLKSDPAFLEALVLSTCNRTEIYVSVINDAFDKNDLISLLFKLKNISSDATLSKSFYSHSGEECLSHLLRVVTGLDSIVLGEKQILGQVKEAIALSRSNGMFQRQFNILSDLIIRAGKKVQRETNISCGGGSVSWAAVYAAQTILKTLRNKSVLIVGAGKMSAMAADLLRNKQLGKLFIVNRTEENAANLARLFGGEVVSMLDLKDVLSSIDVCISSSSAPHYVITHELINEVMALRRGNELVMIDISTPRTIDPRIKQVSSVKLLAIDDLQQIVEDNKEKRKDSIHLVEKIIHTKLAEYQCKQSKLQSLIET